MADREQKHTVNHGKGQKSQHDIAGIIGERHSDRGDPQRDQRHGIKPGGTVGSDVPDESKEHHTEIAVEAGRRGGERRDDER